MESNPVEPRLITPVDRAGAVGALARCLRGQAFAATHLPKWAVRTLASL